MHFVSLQQIKWRCSGIARRDCALKSIPLNRKNNTNFNGLYTGHIMSRYHEDRKTSQQRTILALPLSGIILSRGSECTLDSL